MSELLLKRPPNLGSRAERCCWLCRIASPSTIAAAALVTTALGGCFRPHVTQKVEIEVFDAISGEPVAGACVMHGAPTDKFTAVLFEEATTDARGVATIESIRLVDDAWWQVRRGDRTKSQEAPYYEGVGWSQVPAEFAQVTSDSWHTRYRAPLWPEMVFVINVPADYRGILAWNKVDTDAARDSGWLPPADMLHARFDPKGYFRAIVQPDASGVVAHPSMVAGVPGYDPTTFESFGGPAVWRDGTRLDIVDPSSDLWKKRRVKDATMHGGGYVESTPIDATLVRAWRLRAHRIPGAPDNYFGQYYAWFIGSLDELRAWLNEHELKPLDRSLGWRVDSDDPAATRIYPAHTLYPLIPVATSPSPAPTWSIK